MSKEIEIEFKNLLTFNEFCTLKEAFQLKDADFAVQHNDYFDTPTFDLKEKGSALRIREKYDKLVLTLKQPGEIGLIETHQNLTADQAHQLLQHGELPHGDVLTELNRVNVEGNNMRHLGRLTTYRAELPYRDGLLVFDHSIYGQTEDYELEYEVNDLVQGQKIFLDLLKQYGIPERPTENKIKRLMNAIS